MVRRLRDSIKEEEKAFEFVSKYEEAIIINPDLEYEEFDNVLIRVLNETKITIDKNNIFYRSRIYYEKDGYEKSRLIKTKKLFNGYDEQNSFVKLSNINKGRMNKEGEPCLYISSDKEITLREIDASYNDYISVAGIKNNEELFIADLSQMSAMSNSHYNCLLSLQIQNRICRNYENNNYAFPQYVAFICKKLGYDGIAFKSKYSNYSNPKLNNRGINYAIFNYRKCKAIYSNIYTCCDNQTRLFDDYGNKKVYLSRKRLKYNY